MKRPGARRRFERAPARLVESEGQAELPGEIGPEEVGVVGAVRRHVQGVRPVGVVLAEAEVVVEEVPGAVARDLVEGLPGRALVGVGEQGLDPGGIEALRGPGPAMADVDACGGVDRRLLPALVDDDGETPGGGRAELGRDPERRAPSPPRREGFDLAGRASEGDADLGGVRSENGQDADRLARAAAIPARRGPPVARRGPPAIENGDVSIFLLIH